MKRVTLIVLDSMGVGELPDAEKYGDKGAHTFNHIVEKMKDFEIPNLRELGLGNIEGVADGNLAIDEPVGAFGKMQELSVGKDTITGHWEIAGVETKTPFKTYPNGFPQDFMEAFQREIGVECLGNYPASGTEVIEQLGAEHEKTGKPIVYTSADSVFQIAANIDVVPLEKLYDICQVARNLLVGEWACGRVIARPYRVDNGVRVRTSDRKDYAVSPGMETLLDKVKATGQKVYAIGKISDIFDGQGITDAVHTTDNMDGVEKTIQALEQKFCGLIFTNLVDFDSKFGHRRDPEGYGNAIMEFDQKLSQIIMTMRDQDILILCADHGNDPTHSGWDHTREFVPLLIWGKKIKAGTNLGVRTSFADIGAFIADYLEAEPTAIGTSFLKEIF